MSVINRRTALAGMGGAAALTATTIRSVFAADEPKPAQTLAQRLATYASEFQVADIGVQTIEDTKFKFIDAIGCAIGAIHENPIKAVRAIALNTPSNGATILGTGRKTTVELASFTNGIAVRYFDYNDAYTGKETGHPSDIISGILAVAEAGHRTGMEVVAATVLAYEIDCRFLDTAQISAKGWDHPNFVLPAAALAAGKLMRLPPDRLAEAVNLSLSGHLAMNQTRSQLISDWKGMAAAEAVRAGVFSAQLARAGITGPAPIFEGSAGFFKQVSGDLPLDVTQFSRNKERFKISDCTIKFYPAQTQALTAIPAAVKIGRQITDFSQIANIAVATTKAGMDYTANEPDKWAPKSSGTADHSMPYIVARALLDGVITPLSYAPAKLTEEKVIALMGKLTVKEDPALTALYPGKVPNRVSVTLKDGRTLTEQVDELPGFMSKPMQRADVEDKFHRNVGATLSAGQQKRFLDLAWSLEKQPNLTGLLQSLRVKE